MKLLCIQRFCCDQNKIKIVRIELNSLELITLFCCVFGWEKRRMNYEYLINQMCPHLIANVRFSNKNSSGIKVAPASSFCRGHKEVWYLQQWCKILREPREVVVTSQNIGIWTDFKEWMQTWSEDSGWTLQYHLWMPNLLMFPFNAKQNHKNK